MPHPAKDLPIQRHHIQESRQTKSKQPSKPPTTHHPAIQHHSTPRRKPRNPLLQLILDDPPKLVDNPPAPKHDKLRHPRNLVPGHQVAQLVPVHHHKRETPVPPRQLLVLGPNPSTRLAPAAREFRNELPRPDERVKLGRGLYLRDWHFFFPFFFPFLPNRRIFFATDAARG
ncbi:hypothetical protein J3458_021261 [Metarhizium acridum]|uniref:uncharacterized protein n=1 Tax=Metarhizium acridum TaxID=92637 RepID=UPI001C6B9115|nr:hypothetical protein J3458_021261 [Metarhizium acridum]